MYRVLAKKFKWSNVSIFPHQNFVMHYFYMNTWIWEAMVLSTHISAASSQWTPNPSSWISLCMQFVTGINYIHQLMNCAIGGQLCGRPEVAVLPVGCHFGIIMLCRFFVDTYWDHNYSMLYSNILLCCIQNCETVKCITKYTTNTSIKRLDYNAWNTDRYTFHSGSLPLR